MYVRFPLAAGIGWTVDRRIAEWFANRGAILEIGAEPVLVSTRIPKTMSAVF